MRMKMLFLLVALFALAFCLGSAATAGVGQKALPLSDAEVRHLNFSTDRAACTFQKHNSTAQSYWNAYANGLRTVTYFDPAVHCAPPIYPFQITALTFPLYNWGPAVWPVTVDIVVYSTSGTGGRCNGPGAELCRFSITCTAATFGYPNAGTATFPTPCCVTGPFYIGVEYNDPGLGPYPSVLYDNNTAVDSCDNWQFYTDALWYRWDNFWNPPIPGYPMFSVAGETQSTACQQPCTPRDTVFAGSDLFTTPAGGATVDSHFTVMPIPPSFFDPGSDPFTGSLTLQGSPLQTTPPNILGPTDVVVRRNLDAMLPLPPSSDVVPIEIVALNLVSINPITVTYNGGMNPEHWDVRVCLSVQRPQCVGSMTINRDCPEGGTFSATLPVFPLFTFVRQSDMSVRVLDFGMMPFDPCSTIVFKTLNGHWTYCDPGLGVITAPAGVMVDHTCVPPRPVTITPSSNFFPGVRALPCCPDSATQGHTKQLTEEEAQLAQHGVLPPQEAPPDADGDNIPDDADNCPAIPNPLQEDQDDDHIGDICDPDPTNPPPSLACENAAGPCDCIPGDANGDVAIDISDAVYLIGYIFAGGPAPIPYALCSGDANCDCAVDISDAVYLISYIFGGGPAPCSCERWLQLCGPPLRK